MPPLIWLVDILTLDMVEEDGFWLSMFMVLLIDKVVVEEKILEVEGRPMVGLELGGRGGARESSQRGDDLDNISHPKADFSGVDCFQRLLCEEPSSGAMSEEEIMIYRARQEPLKDTMFPSLFGCFKKQLFLITALRSLIDCYQLYAISRISRGCWRRLHTSTTLKASKTHLQHTAFHNALHSRIGCVISRAVGHSRLPQSSITACKCRRNAQS